MKSGLSPRNGLTTLAAVPDGQEEEHRLCNSVIKKQAASKEEGRDNFF